eukprot:1158997-Pelagomonas_calceolata.AAC.4
MLWSSTALFLLHAKWQLWACCRVETLAQYNTTIGCMTCFKNRKRAVMVIQHDTQVQHPTLYKIRCCGVACKLATC